MELTAGSTVSAQAGSAPAWPVPPLFQPAAAPPDGHGLDCSVELLDGRILTAELLDLAADTVSLKVALPGHGAEQQRIDLGQVRMIRMTIPLSPARESDEASGAGIDAAGDSAFSVRFRDGNQFDGTTYGMAREEAGLFLFLPATDPSRALPCFIPAQQLDDVRVDSPVQGSARASSKAMAAELNRQAEFRQEQLGKRLSDRGVDSQEELRHALLAQKRRPAMKLGELLLEAGLISTGQLAEALRLQSESPERRLGDILADMGIVTLRLVQMALSEKLGIPYVNLREFEVDPLALKLVSASFARHHQVLPLMRMNEALVVAMENPLTMDFMQELAFLTGQNIMPVIANPDDLRLQISRQYASLELGNAVAGIEARSTVMVDDQRNGGGQRTLDELTTELDRQAPLPRASRDDDFDARVTDNALVRLINRIIIEAHAQGASDIHIESNAGTANTRIRFRKDGELEDYIELRPAYRNALISRIKIMADLDISEHRRAQDGKIAFERFGPLQIELRVAILPTSNNLEDAVLRILGGVEPLPLDRLGLVGRDLDEIRKMVTRSYGLILVCGPTGSGKTTTLHSVLHTINRPDIKIWTAEDPVEITQAGLRQVQINSRIGWTFAAAMRAFLRADPDVIMVGEMRDAETTSIGIEASLTGHLVFSTLHTNSAAESVIRLLELGMDPFNFADALIGILSQRLARKLCVACRKPRTATGEEILALAQEYCIGSKLEPAVVIGQWKQTYAPGEALLLYEADGCKACNHGYKGRIGVYELLSGTPKIKNLIRSRGTVPEVLEAAQESGMRLLRQDAIEKVLSGVLDLASARGAST